VVAIEVDYPERILEAGIAAAPLVARPATWINRRVETIRLLSHEETRRQVSVDFTLSRERKEKLAIDHGVVVPISVMTKEARRNFDLRDESGSAVPVLGKNVNGTLAHVAVMSEVFDAVPNAGDHDQFELVWTELREVVIAEPGAAGETLSDFVGKAEQGEPLRSAIWSNSSCRTLLEMLQSNYVLFAVVTRDCPERRVLKYSFSEDFRFDREQSPSLSERLAPSAIADRVWKPGRGTFQLLCPGAWRAESFHVEVVIPEELRIDLAILYDFGREEVLSMPDRNRNRASLYPDQPITPDLDAVAYVVIAAERRGGVIQAAATGVIVSALIWLGVVSGLDFKNPDAAGASASVVLAGAALYSGITAARGESSLVSQIFATSRVLLGCISLCALAASATLAMEIPDTTPTAVWLVAAILASVASSWLIWSALRAPGNLRKENAASNGD
jgi:drug/metabolite transporter superfamily protein YnfA